MKITFEANFDGLANVFEDYESAKERVWRIRRELGYRRNECIWLPTAPREFKDAVVHCDAKAEGTNALWYASHKLYKAVAMTRRIDKRFMIMHNWARCLPERQLERLMDYYMREDD